MHAISTCAVRRDAEEYVLRSAGFASNTKAEKLIRAALERAMVFDCSRFVIPDSNLVGGSAGGCECIGKAPSVVEVLGPPDPQGCSEVRYRMLEPHKRFAACDCAAATQRKMCHHQLAYLLQQSLNRDEALDMMFELLGTRFGYEGGCDEHDISAVWEGLRDQVPAPPPLSSVCAEHAAGVLTAVPGPLVAATGADDQPAPAPVVAAPAPAGLGVEARRLLRQDLLQSLERMLQQLDLAPPAAQASLASQSRSAMAGLEQAHEAAVQGLSSLSSGADFQTSGGGSQKRHMSWLESSKRGGQKKADTRPAPARVSQQLSNGSTVAAAQPRPTLPQADFAHAAACTGGSKFLISKPWQGRIPMPVAAQRVQDSLNQRAAGSSRVVQQPLRSGAGLADGSQTAAAKPGPAEAPATALSAIGSTSNVATAGPREEVPVAAAHRHAPACCAPAALAARVPPGALQQLQPLGSSLPAAVVSPRSSAEANMRLWAAQQLARK